MPFYDFDKIDAAEFGEKLRAWRKERGYTQQDIATSMQLSGLCCDSDRISAIERGKVRISGFELYVLIAAFDLDPRKMF